ncbi:TIGR03751 family conjugal transfer lipoprotein [Gallibacterium anatis]|uniref:Conjugal transfer protein n=1 Tax=Gallibacterium anatis 12656/12 TaxID=1195244 RepID=U1I2T4_9PAST|nr:TIGR03751 family conjugal transfer lipoprotein [Gallibacterium anatis]ERF77605.1 conjugal transfer protein [Gallibacterium anatis 12656/12]MBP4133620.1 TIGR03751 family conjugal transfer lipoprotein [Gallibacterium anatis]WAX71168.1 TIGR03751 family conjugal transfer lipoprotein [Gallibacterium anatis]WKS97466.1 TIGR03751 family conjugal transfer lipoprotein [Gallibacterium anatis]
MKKRLILSAVVTTFLLSACSTSQKALLPTSNETMREIWNKGGSDAQLQLYRSQDNRQIDPVSYISVKEQRAYTRTAENEIKNLFPQLPNPDLIMYVYPHLSSSEEQMPIPGYSTVIPFYGRVQYAQPGERTRGL